VLIYDTLNLLIYFLQRLQMAAKSPFVEKFPALNPMKHKTRIASFSALSLAGLMIGTSSASAALIAYEGFATGSGGYVDGRLIETSGNNGNQDTILGNTGFTATNVWTNDTSSAEVRFAGALSHNLTVSPATGAAVYWLANNTSGNGRNTNRLLGSTAPSSSSYFMSGVVRYNAASALAVGTVASVGFLNTTVGGNLQNAFNFDTGLHLGLTRDSSGYNLVALSGSSTPITLLTGASVSTSYQIVLQLDVNASGTESLTAWYAADGATNLTLAGTFTGIESFSSTADVSRMIVQSRSGGAGHTANQAFFDEVYFGTAFGDVTTAPIPEPSTAAALAGVAMLGAAALRRRRR
jgi:hypothetical protein